jgi:cell fate regulator YaaT (PSP1 superfamily)
MQIEKETKKIIENPFLSRGCCSVPKAYDSKGIFSRSCSKLSDYDHYQNIRDYQDEVNIAVEVSFKNGRKDFFKVSFAMNIELGDFVAVESTSSGHDIGIVSLLGVAAKAQMRKKEIKTPVNELKSIYRRAKVVDIEKWVEAVKKENETYRRTKVITMDMKLNMKINDVEYQGDGTKATFYYTAEERVDFRELIRVLASTFQTRIEMRQIGARQEAAKIGGVGPCGRELCCASWMHSFTSITTNYARTQQLSLNPQKLAGQCGKLKCCLKFENDTYEEALKEFPSAKTVLKAKNGKAVQQKVDVLQRKIWYSYLLNDKTSSLIVISLDDVYKIINLNKQNKFPDNLTQYAEIKTQDSLIEIDNIEAMKQFEEKFL